MAFGAGGDSSGAGLDCCERDLLDAVLKWPVERGAIDLNDRVTFGIRARRRAREKGDGERSGVGDEAMVTDECGNRRVDVCHPPTFQVSF